jgi:hypothetical protein
MKRLWSNTEINYVKANYADLSSVDIAQKLNRPLSSIYGLAYKLGLKKSEAFLKSEKSGRLSAGDKRIGTNTQFIKGHKPANAGKKMEEFMSPETLKKFKSNFFKKGNVPHNAYKDWEEGFVKFSDGNSYIRIKVPGIRKLVFKHVWLFMKAHGSIPEGHVISFIDGNSMNCVFENLKAIPKTENMKRNSIMRFPEELRSVIRLLSKLNKSINEKQD